jgi:CheY-like chemotaxis protein
VALNANSRTRINLAKTVVLLLDSSGFGMAVLTQILAGFGVRQVHKCRSVDEAKKVVREFQIDLMIVDTMAATREGFEFVRWLRREVPPPNRHTPVLLTAAHIGPGDLATARDCGSHFVVSKPLSPVVLLERILWVAKEGRAFVQSNGFIGPDRRFGREDARKERRPRRQNDDATLDMDEAAEDAIPDAERAQAAG